MAATRFWVFRQGQAAGAELKKAAGLFEFATRPGFRKKERDFRVGLEKAAVKGAQFAVDLFVKFPFQAVPSCYIRGSESAAGA